MHSYSAMILLFAFVFNTARAGTNIITSKSATTDKSLLVSFSTDSRYQHGYLRTVPARKQAGDSIRMKVYDSQTGQLRGEITQPAQSYSITGIMNERQVTIAECTFACRPELVSDQGILDYTNLVMFTLQQAYSARHAVKILTQLAQLYGYYGQGECLAIADIHEAWIMEFVGRADGTKGILWVARKIPEGYISAQANVARITTFPLNDISTCMYAQDLISYARRHKLYSGNDVDFSFRDTYAPLTYEGFLWGEARVWSIFSRVAPSQKFTCTYTSTIITDQLPLWVKPDQQLSLANVKALMRNHFEGTPLDMTKGKAAGTYGLPYRPDPLSWANDSIQYYHHRPISVQHTRCSGIAQLRHWLPNPLGGVLWFGVDDSYFTLYQPMYCGILSAPRTLLDIRETPYLWDSQYWIFNLVSNYTYSQYNKIAPVVIGAQESAEKRMRQSLQRMDNIAAEHYILHPDSTRALITQYCDSMAYASNKIWQHLAVDIMLRFPAPATVGTRKPAVQPRTFPSIARPR